MISVEKPGTPAEILEHHGTKGMRWGVRKHSTSQQRTKSIRRSRAESFKQRETFKTADKGSAARIKAKNVYLKNPDRATQLRFTRGEKIVLTMLAVGFPPSAPALAIGSVTRVAIRKGIERKQERGSYD